MSEMTDEQYRSKPERHKRAVRARLLIEQAERMLHEANGEVIGAQGHRSRINDDIEREYGVLQTLAKTVDLLIRQIAP